MSQISAGTANVTNGNNIVQLPGVDLSGVVSGHAFHIRGIDAVYSIIAAAPAASPPTVTLSVNYAGITAIGVEYRITTGFSPNNNLYEPDPGDVDIPMLLKHRLVRPIDSGLNNSLTGIKTILSYPGSDDTARIMNMVADVGQVVIPAGYTAMVEPLSISTLKCVFTGLGGYAVVKLLPNCNADLLTFDGTLSGGGYFGADRIYFDGNRGAQSSNYYSAVVRLRNASYTVLSRCVIIDGFGDGIGIDNYQASPDADEINIENCSVFFNNQCGIRMRQYGTVTQAPGDHIIANNHINYNGNHGIYTPSSYALVITGNNILTNTGAGIHMSVSSRSVISNNQVRYNAMTGLFGDGISNSQIIGNQFHLNNRATGGVNMDVWNSSDVVIAGNHCNDADFTPINLYGAQIANCNNIAITGNVFRGLYGGCNISISTYTASGNQGLADSDRVYWDIDTQSINGVQRIRHGFDNFLGNSNFEHWLDGVNAAPSAWTVQGDVTVSRSSTATAGAYSAQLVFGTGNTGELYQVIPTNTVVDYTFSCYVQRTAGTGRARLVAQQADAPYTEFASVELSTVAGWQPAMLTVKPSAGSLLRFAIKSYDNVASTWLIDECMFEESKGVAST